VAYRPDPIPELKRLVADEIRRRIDGWRTADIAVHLGTDQPRLSDIRQGKLQRFSLETLIRFATRLRCRVELRVTDQHIERRAER
jgi:predicted XRE-type DNA-binding protein